MTTLSSYLARVPQLRAVFAPFARRFGFEDLVAIAANDGTGHGVIVNFVVDDRRQPAGAARRVAAVLPHVAAALRVRRAMRSPEIVLDAGGQVRDGQVSTSDRERLRAAVHARDRAHTRAGRAEPDAALAAWTALVDGRWSLLDSFERGGARYVVAIPNLPGVAHPRRLAPIERAVLALLMLGHGNKMIAYELGLSTSTVAGQISAIRAKLTRPVLTGASHVDPGRVARVCIGDLELMAIVTEDDEARLAALAALPPAERAVIGLALEGLSNAAIARRRDVSARTVANQLASAYRRLAVSSRRELVARLQHQR